MSKPMIIETRKVSKTYTDVGVPVQAVKEVDLTIKEGEFTAVVGPSGSGKTTLMNVISGLDSASEGEVYLKGEPLSEMSGTDLSDFRRDHIGFIFQAYNLIPVLTVEENIEYIMLLQRVPEEERHQRVLKILKQVGLQGFENRKPPRLSGGQQQRVAVARAMVAQPDLILADEPTANLDSKTGSQLLEMMRELNQETGMTFIFSTHDPIVIDKARRVVTLKDGKIIEDDHQKKEKHLI